MPLKRILLLLLLLTASAAADTMIVQINGDTLTNWTASTGDDWSCVDEYPYSDADYVTTTGTANGLYQCADSTLPVGAVVSSVTVWIRVKSTSAEDAVRPIFMTKTLRYGTGAITDPANVYQDYDVTYTVANWNQDSVNCMKVGIDPYGTPVGTITVSSVYAIINYTIVTGYPAGVRADNAGAYPRASNTAVQVRGKQ